MRSLLRALALILVWSPAHAGTVVDTWSGVLGGHEIPSYRIDPDNVFDLSDNAFSYSAKYTYNAASQTEAASLEINNITLDLSAQYSGLPDRTVCDFCLLSDTAVGQVNILGTTYSYYFTNIVEQTTGDLAGYFAAYTGPQQDFYNPAIQENTYMLIALQPRQFAFGVGAVPELSTWGMLLIGFAGIGAIRYRRRKSAWGLTFGRSE